MFNNDKVVDDIWRLIGPYSTLTLSSALEILYIRVLDTTLFSPGSIYWLIYSSKSVVWRPSVYERV
jgi:hypothetical protein